MTTTTSDCEIVSTRIVDAPQALVYRAWTEPEHLQNWWGPAGFTNTFNEFNLRVGGKWSFIMHGPDKGNYLNECEFTTIEPPSKIAFKRLSKPLFSVVAMFEDLSAKQTKVIFKQIFPTVAERNKIKVFAVEKNEENLDRLEAELRAMRSANNLYSVE